MESIGEGKGGVGGDTSDDYVNDDIGDSFSGSGTEMPADCGREDFRAALAENLEFLCDFLRNSSDKAKDLECFFSEFLDEQIYGEDVQFVVKRLESYMRSRSYVDEIRKKKVAGRELYVTQKEAALGFYEWMKSGVFEKTLMGRLVVPTGAGKTFTAVMLAEMAGGKSVFVANSNSDAGQAASAFREHFGDGEVADFYGKRHLHEPGTHTVTTFFKSKKWEDIDWENVGVLFVDEADVNALSPVRSGLIRDLAEKYGFPVIGISATERQYSGKRLGDVFPDEILRLPMPKSLSRCLELGLIPEIEFNDLYLDCVLKLDPKDYWAEDIGVPVVSEFVRSNLWNKAIIDHYIENFRHGDGDFIQGIVIFRSNILVDDFVKQAKERGIRAVPFTGDMDEGALDFIKGHYSEGNIDLLVGSRLLGRGLDIPGINVVYNSTITCSPQIFWQAAGRGFRRDPNNIHKKAKIYAVVPSRVINKRTGEEVLPGKRPLTHASFFDPDYFFQAGNRSKDLNSNHKNEAGRIKIKTYDLNDIDTVVSEENIRRIRLGGRADTLGFGSKPMMVARALSMMHETEMPLWEALDAVQSYRRARNVLPALRENEEDYLAGAGKEWISRRTADYSAEFSKKHEAELLREYKSLYNEDPAANAARMREIESIIVKAYTPFINEVCRYYVRTLGIDEGVAADYRQDTFIVLIKYIRDSVRYENSNILPVFIKCMMHSFERMPYDMPQVNIGHRMQQVRRMFLNGDFSHEKAEKIFGSGRADLYIQSSKRLAFESDFIVPYSEMTDYDTEHGTDPLIEKPGLPDEILLEDEVRVLFEDLRERIRKVFGYRVEMVDMYFGFGDYKDEDHTYASIGQKYGISGEAVRQRLCRIYSTVRMAGFNHAAVGLRAHAEDKLILLQEDLWKDQLF